MEYSDGPEGVLCERLVVGCVTLAVDGRRVPIKIDIDTSSSTAATAGRDLYELEVSGSGPDGEPSAMVLYDFTRIKELGATVPLPGFEGLGGYGRQETLTAFTEAMNGCADASTIVTCEQARLTAEIIEAMKGRA